MKCKNCSSVYGTSETCIADEESKKTCNAEKCWYCGRKFEFEGGGKRAEDGGNVCVSCRQLNLLPSNLIIHNNMTNLLGAKLEKVYWNRYVEDKSISTDCCEEARIRGRTEALDFVGSLIKKWKKDADHKDFLILRTFVKCAEELEAKIEEFAKT